MNEPSVPAPAPGPAPVPPPFDPAATGGLAQGKPKSRTWFVVLAWITLILFGIFAAGITAVTVFLPQIKVREASR